MLNLEETREGELGRTVFTSELLAASLQSSFTGGVAIEAPEGQLVVLFKGGRPVHASGSLVPSHRLGEILQERGAVVPGVVATALAELESSEGSKPLSGALLVKHGVEPREIKLAIQEQARRRIREIWGLTEGTWKAAPGESPHMRDVGVQLDPLPLFVEDLPASISDPELRYAADRWLGKAIKLRPGGPGPVADLQAEGNVAAILRYLEKPRKPDQLERATRNRRTVRLVLRVLDLLGRLEDVPAKKAIPIPKATLLKGQAFTGYTAPGRESAAEEPATEEAPTKPTLSSEDKLLIAEIDKRHAGMGQQNHFEVLGVSQSDSSEALREKFTAMAKRFHPDSMGPNFPAETASKARELTARLNDAYQTLASKDSREQYVAMLADERIRGDMRRAELVRDAETKSEMAKVMLRKRDYEKARKLYQYCVEADPVSVIYKARLANAMYADAKFDRQEAYEKGYPLILEALKNLGESSAEVHEYAGLALKEREKLKEALHHFKEASKLDPRNTDYQREVRLLEGRIAKAKEAAKEEKKSGLGRLFKR